MSSGTILQVTAVSEAKVLSAVKGPQASLSSAAVDTFKYISIDLLVTFHAKQRPLLCKYTALAQRLIHSNFALTSTHLSSVKSRAAVATLRSGKPDFTGLSHFV